MRSARRFTAVGVAAALAALAAAPALAQQDVSQYFGRPVRTVSLAIEDRPETSPDLAAALEVKAGEALDPAAVRNSIAHLFSLGRFDDVVVLVTQTVGGLDVLFRLIPKHPIDSLRFEGDTGLAPDQLDRLVRQRYGGLPTGARLPSVESAVAELLKDEGYLDATVKTRIDQTHQPDRATLVFQVAAGPRTLIRSVTVTGKSPLADDEVRDKTDTATGRPYRASAIEAGLAVIRDDLRKQGYYAVEATRDAATVTDHSVDLTLRIEAGPHVTLTFPKDPPPSPVDAFVPIEREGSVDDDLLEDSRQNLQNGLKQLGYWHADVQVARRTEGDELSIVFTITRGQLYHVDRYEITGNEHLPVADIVRLIGVAPGAPFDESGVATGLRRVVATYLRQGFFSISIEPRVEELTAAATPAEGRVVVQLAIKEGPAAHIADVVVQGARALSAEDVRAAMRSKPGTPYVVADLNADRDALQTMYADRGFEQAAVTIGRRFDENQQAVTLSVNVTEGPQLIVDTISVVGNRRLKEQWIRDQLALKEGQPYGASARRESQQKLLDSGSFRRVSVDRESLLPGQTRVHVIVSVEEAPATTIAYGAGLEGGRRPRAALDGGQEEFFELAPRGFFDIARNNLFGKPRAINLFSRLSLRPRSAPGDPLRDGRGFGFTEYRLATTYSDRRFLGSSAELLFGASSEQASRTDFNFLRNEATIQALRRVMSHVAVSARYAINKTRLFDSRIQEDQQLDVDRLFPQVRLSIVGTSVSFDNRDDPTNPTRGMLLSADGEAAARAIGSQVGYLKTFMQAALFHALTSSQRVVFAGRVQVGAARAFARTVVDENGNTSIVDDLPASQRFFAGGGTTVRGFGQDRLGVPAIITSDGLSAGGNGLIILNAELRTIVGRLWGRNFGVVGFSDAGNVFARAGDMHLGALRSALGFGVRYDSPLGPVRLGFGFKLRRHVIGGKLEGLWEYHLNFGEAF